MATQLAFNQIKGNVVSVKDFGAVDVTAAVEGTDIDVGTIL